MPFQLSRITSVKTPPHPSDWKGSSNGCVCLDDLVSSRLGKSFNSAASGLRPEYLPWGRSRRCLSSGEAGIWAEVSGMTKVSVFSSV